MVFRSIHTAILGALLLAPAVAWSGPACGVKPTQLIAAWESSDGDDFEQFALSEHDGRRGFDSWLRERLEFLDGTWTFDPKTCRLRIDHPTSEQRREHAVRMSDPSPQLLREPTERRSARYRKIAHGR